MAYSSKLCNPTPFKVEINWDRGVDVIVEAYGASELTMQQMDDCRPGKPGSAEIKHTLDYFGVFLLDSDRPYDNQALDACERSLRAKKEQYDAVVLNLTNSRAAQGIAVNDDAMEETLRLMGYLDKRKEIEALGDAVKAFREAVGDQPEASLRQQLDPKRTVFVTDPPRQFPSVASMEFFLTQNPEIDARHKAFSSRGETSAPTQVPESSFDQEGSHGQLSS